MFQATEYALYKSSADLIFQHEIDRTPSLEQGMAAIEKIAGCVFGFPNPKSVSPSWVSPT